MPTVRSDIVEVYVFRRTPEAEFLLLRRAEPPMAGTWQPIIGHLKEGETAAAGAARELEEETGLGPPAWRGLWALEQVHPYFMPFANEIVLSPRFAAEAAADWVPRLDAEHSESRWVPAADAAGAFLWPGQAAACREVLAVVVAGGPAANAMRLYAP